MSEVKVNVSDLLAELRRADEAASVAHDFIWPQAESLVTKEEASDAIWTIHEVLRSLIRAAYSEARDELVAEQGTAPDTAATSGIPAEEPCEICGIAGGHIAECVRHPSGWPG